MRSIKIISCILLISVGFLFNGELFILYLDNFQDSYYQSSFAFAHTDDKISSESIISEVSNAASKNNVDIFMIDAKIVSDNKKEINIYGTANALRQLKAKGIRDKSYGSLFFGEVKLSFSSLEEIKDIKGFEDCYYIGGHAKRDNMNAFKRELVNKYGGGFPKLYSSENETWLNLFSVWGIITVLLLLICLYEVLYQKKEIAVRIVSGENLSGIFLKNVLIDISSFAIMFSLLPICLRYFSNVMFKISTLRWLFLAILSLVVLIDALILHINFKKSLSSANDGATMLNLSYALKLAMSVLLIIVLSGNILLLKKGYEMHKQRDFFENHSEYSYYHIGYKDINTTDEQSVKLQMNFYEKFFDDSLVYLDFASQLTSVPNEPYVILMNMNAIRELQKENQETDIFKAVTAAGSPGILLPSSIHNNSVARRMATELYSIYFEKEANDIPRYLSYDTDIEIVGTWCDNNYRINNFKNPIIIFYDDAKIVAGEHVNLVSDTMYGGAMYKISDSEAKKFIEYNNLQNEIFEKSNVLDVYEYNWAVMYRAIRLTVVLSLLMTLLEISLMFFIIRIYYRLNATELVLKKVHGYSLLSRNKRIIIIVSVGSAMGVLLTMTSGAIMRLQLGVLPVVIGGVFWLLEIAYILWKAKSMEAHSMLSILKGERI